MMRFLTCWGKQYFTLRTVEKSRRYEFVRLKRLIEHAWKNVPFYRRYWSENGFDPSKFNSLDDMQRIPLVDKRMIIENLDDCVATNIDKARLSKVITGGTTGMPMTFYIDNYKARAKEMAHQMYATWHIWGYRQGIDKCVTLRGARISDERLARGVYWTRSKLDRGIIMSSFHLLEQNYQVYIDKIRTERPRYIRAYPSSIVALCTLMKNHNDLGLEGLRGVLCSSETIYEWQRNLVKEVLNVPIYGSYGHTEKAVWAFEQNGKYLFPPRYGYAEFVDDAYNPVTKVGEQAQIIATGFDIDSFPFIRYKTEDLAVVGESEPGYPQVAECVLGRSQEFVIDREGNKVLFTCSDEIFWGIDGVDAYQYIQDVPGKLKVNICISSQFDMAKIEILKKEAIRIFINFDIDIAIVADIPKTRSGKFRYLIQNIKL